MPELASCILWSDPKDEEGCEISIRRNGYQFGPDYTRRFLKENNLQLLIRSHEVKEQGYEWTHNKNVLTIFSSSKYEGLKNKAAIAHVTFSSESNKPEIMIEQLSPFFFSSNFNPYFLPSILFILMMIALVHVLIIIK